MFCIADYKIDKHLGPVSVEREEAVLQRQQSNVNAVPTIPDILPLSACQSLVDIRKVAFKKLFPKARTYFEGGTETLSAIADNAAQWHKVKFRPRILRNVAKVSMQCSIMGVESRLPVFVAPAAMAKLGHPDGELCLARGAARMAIPQCVSTYASVAHEDISSCWQNEPHRRGGGPIFQLYVPREKSSAEKLILKAKALGFQALVVTVDSPVVGKRDEDDKFKALLDHEAGMNLTISELPPLPGDEAVTLRSVHCHTLEWSDLPWIRRLWGENPIILKGIQSAEDAYHAMQYGVQGIYLSNHGGRQLDHAPTSLETLLEIRTNYPEVLQRVEVYLDGGVSRGTDVVKALCLGARAVGLGRGFMYALSAYGTEGVIRTIQSKTIPTFACALVLTNQS
jgi:L-lactate dehydrogenase (cytochrome)